MADNETVQKVTIESNAPQVSEEFKELVVQLKSTAAAMGELTISNKAILASHEEVIATTKKNTEALSQHTREIKEHVKEDREWALGLRETAGAFRELTAPMELFGEELGPIGEGLIKTASSFSTMGTAANAAAALGFGPLTVAIPLLGAGLVGLGAVATHFAIEFEEQMTKIAVVTLQPEEELKGLDKIIKDVAHDVGEMDATKIAGSYAQVAGRLQTYNEGLGLSVEEQGKFIEAAAKLSTVTDDDKGSFEGLTTVMTAYKLKIDDLPMATEQLFNLWRMTGISVNELGQNLGRLVARGGPQSLDSAVSVFIAASQAGLQGAQSFRQVTTVLDDLAASANKMNPEMERLGITQEEWTGTDAQERLKMLGEKWAELGSAQEIANSATAIFGSPSVGGAAASIALQLAQHGERVNEVLTETGHLDEALAKQQEDLTRQWNEYVTGIKNWLTDTGALFIQDIKNFGTLFSTLGTTIHGALDEFIKFKDAAAKGIKVNIDTHFNIPTGQENIPQAVRDQLGIGTTESSRYVTPPPTSPNQVNVPLELAAHLGLGGGNTKQPTTITYGGVTSQVGNATIGPDESPETHEVPGGLGSYTPKGIEAFPGQIAARQAEADEAAAQALRDEAAAQDEANAAAAAATVKDQQAVDRAEAAAIATKRKTEYMQEYGEAADAVLELEKKKDDAEKGFIKSTDTLKVTSEIADKIAEIAQAGINRGVPGAKDISDNLINNVLGGLFVSDAQGHITMNEEKLADIEAGLKRLGEIVPEKKPGAPKVEPKTAAQQLAESLSTDRASVAEEAGEVGAAAIGALQKAIEERKDSLERTGKDTTSGAAQSLGTAYQKLIDDVRKIGVEGWQEADAEIRPLLMRAMGGDDSAAAQAIEKMKNLGQQLVEAQQAEAWAKAWETKANEIAKQVQKISDAQEAEQEKVRKQLYDENEKYADDVEKINYKAALKTAEEWTKGINEVRDEHTKAAQQIAEEHVHTLDREADADEEYTRKVADQAEKRKEESAVQGLETGLKSREEALSHEDKLADLVTKRQRFEEDLSRDKTLTAQQRIDKEKEFTVQEQRAREDANTAYERQKRDEQAREQEQQAAIKLKQTLEDQAEKTTHDRKIKDLETEEGRRDRDIKTAEANRVQEITQKHADEMALETLKTDFQKTYHQTEMELEDKRHAKKLSDILTEQEAATHKQIVSIDQSVADLRNQSLTTWREKHGGSDAGFEEFWQQQNVRGALMGSLGGPPTSGYGLGNANYFNYLNGYESGGEFVVSGAGNRADSALVAFMATQGERVTVTPPNQGGDKPVTVDLSPLEEALKKVGDRPIMVYLDGKQIESSVTNRQYKVIENRVAVGGRF